MIATGILSAFAFRQSRDTRRQIALARDEFISTHRPKLILRQAYAPRVQGQRIQVQLVISNIGESDAWIVESTAYLELFKPKPGGLGLLLTPDSTGVHDLTTLQPRFISGQERKFVLWDERSKLNWDADTSPAWVKPWGLYLVGRYVYIDEANTRRQTAFRRWYDARAERFIKVYDDGTEHEYAD